MYYVYILSNTHNTTLYVAIKNDIERRIFEHKTGKYKKGFTFRYNVTKLVWYDTLADACSAALKEKQLKKWNRV